MAPLTGEDFHNPALTGPRASHSIPGGGQFSSAAYMLIVGQYASIKINAPPQLVYDAILNVGQWKEWNSFVYDVTITKNANPHDRKDLAHKRMTGGTCMIFHRNITYDPPQQASARQVVTLVEKLKLSSDGHTAPCITRVRWMLDNAAISTPGFMLKIERINEIEEAQDGTTIYRTWEVFAGPIARTLKKRFEQPWKHRMQDSCRDLKKWCEEQHAPGAVLETTGEGWSEGGQAQSMEKTDA